MLCSVVAVASGIAEVWWVTPDGPWGKVVAGLFGGAASLAGLGWVFTIGSHWWQLTEGQYEERSRQVAQTRTWWERYYRQRRQ